MFHLFIGTGHIDVTVAIPPAEVYIEVNGTRIENDLEVNLDDQKDLKIDCVATKSRPVPKIRFVLIQSFILG